MTCKYSNCTSLTSVHITDLAAWCKISFGSNPLRYAKHLYLNGEEITDLMIPNSVTSIESYAFENCSSLTSVTIPNSVTSIGFNVFANCTNLASATIPNSVTSIESYAFEYCSSLTSVTIPNSVTNIESKVFEGCSSLTSIVIPNSVTSIGSSAFSGCSGLTSVSIGTGVQKINSKAFANCPELADVFCYTENAPSTSTNAFEGSYIEYATLHVPDASIDLYKAAEPWKNFKTIVGLNGTIPETQKCATPTIQIVGGKMKFTCETEDATFKTTYKVVDPGNNAEGDEVVVGGTAICQVCVYATKNGYMDSDVATANVEIAWGKKGDVNSDGEVNVGDIVTTTNIMAGKDE